MRLLERGAATGGRSDSRTLVVVWGLGLFAAACQAQPVERPAAPPPPAAIEVTMREFRFDAVPAEVPAGRVVFRLPNKGQQLHQPALVILPDNLPPILEQLRSDSRRIVNPLANTTGFPPGTTGAYAVDLEPGQRYAFVCYAKSPDNSAHSKEGMAWEFRAGGESARPSTTVEGGGDVPAG